MALKDRIIEIAYKLKDQFTGGAGKITGSMKKIESASDKAALKIEANNKRAAGSFGLISKGITPVKVAFVALGAAVAGILSQIGKWTTAAAIQERAEVKLATSLRNLAGASDEEIEALKERAKALEKLTGYTDQSILSAQSMLATFALTSDQIGELTPRLLDMAESARKAGKDIDLEQIAIALGKTLTAGIGALGEYGVAMTDAQKKGFKLADQQEKIRILTEVLDANFIGLAEAVGKEYDGAMRKADASHGDFLETLGKIFTQNKAWVKLTELVGKTWDQLAEGISGSGKEIGYVVTKLAQYMTVFAGGIRVSFNAAQIVVKTASVAIAEAIHAITYLLSKVTFGDVSKRFRSEAAEIKKYANELRDGISDDFGDIEDAVKGVAESFDEIEEPAKKAGKAIKNVGDETKLTEKEIAQLDRSAKLLNDSLDDAASKYEKDAKALKDAKKSAKELKEEFADLTSEMRRGTEEAKDLTVLDVKTEINKATRALDQGDEEGALEGARKAGDLLRTMKEEGKETDIVLTGMAQLLEQLAGNIAKASTEDELIKADASKAALDELIAKKQKLVEGPINLRMTLDTAAIDSFKPKEIVIPVRYEVVGGVPTFGSTGGGIDISKEARKQGGRPL